MYINNVYTEYVSFS